MKEYHHQLYRQPQMTGQARGEEEERDIHNIYIIYSEIFQISEFLNQNVDIV